MEGFLESFLYLLITIVILVLSMRRKKPVEPHPEAQPEREDPFAGVFADEEEEYLPEIRPSRVDDYGNYNESEDTPWMSDKEAADMVMDADAVMKEAAENNPIARYEGQIEEDAYDTSSSDDHGVPFDLKRAVIYSVIIERRAFQEF